MRYVLLLVLMLPGSLIASPIKPYFSFSSESFAEPMAIDDFVHGLDGKPDKGEVAYTSSSVEGGITWQRGNSVISFSGIYRYDYFLKFSDDTIKLLHDINQKIHPYPGDTFDIELEAEQIRAQGIKLGITKVYENLRLYSAVSILDADKFLSGQITGTITAESNNSYLGSISLDDVYSEDPLLDRQTTQPSGMGYSMDFAVQYAFLKQYRIELMIKDLFSSIRWEDAPYTIATAENASLIYDSEGQLNKPPVLTGYEGYKTYDQRLPVKINSRLVYFQHSISYQIGLTYNEYLTDLQLGSSYEFSNFNLGIGYKIQQKALSLSFRKNGYYFTFQTDTLPLDQSQSIGLFFGYNGLSN